MLLKIAWRNLWRNKRRSFIIMASIVTGMIIMMLDNSFSTAMIRQILDNKIKSHIAHIQIHKKGYHNKKEIKEVIPEHEKVERELLNYTYFPKQIQEYDKKFIKFHSVRLSVFGLISSASSSSGITLIGVEWENEQKVTTIKQSIVEGKYLNGKKSEIVISKKLADKLEVELGDKIVAVANNPEGMVCSELFRVSGIYKTASTDFDRIYGYVNLNDLQSMLVMDNKVSEYAIIVNEPDQTQHYKRIIQNQLGVDYEVLTYKELLPLEIMQIEIYNRVVVIFYLIIGIAVMFGIINSMLMSVFERVPEIGVLMSIGMKNCRIFIMILYEALCLGILGTVVGFIFGYIIYLFLSNNGIDLSIFSESLASYGLNTIIYPVLDIRGVLNIIFIIPFISVVAAIYPSLKAIKLQPTDAMRYV